MDPDERLGKRELRRLFRSKRRALSDAEQLAHAEQLAEALLPTFDDDDVVAVYRANDGEIDLAPLADRCWDRGIATVLPVVSGETMRFARYSRETLLARGAFDTEEPEHPDWLDPSIVLVPLVAFDRHGARLGRGGGFYDRYLAAAPQSRAVGVAHSIQASDRELPIEHHDVRLTKIVTEQGFEGVLTQDSA